MKSKTFVDDTLANCFGVIEDHLVPCIRHYCQTDVLVGFQQLLNSISAHPVHISIVKVNFKFEFTLYDNFFDGFDWG